ILGSPSPRQAAARRSAKLAGKISPLTVHQERDCGCDPLCALALACAQPLRRRWTVGDRQLGGRTGASRRRPRTQELPFLWLELRRGTSCRNLLAGPIGGTPWTRTPTLSAAGP